MSNVEVDNIASKQKINLIIGYIVIFAVLFFAFDKGGNWYAHHKMIKQQDERVEFILKNNNSQTEKCTVISSAISTANTLTDQKALDRYKMISQNNGCESSSVFVDGISTPQDAAAYAEQQARN